MTVYYRAPGLRITHQVIEAHYPSCRRIPIGELRDVYGVRTGRGRLRRYQLWATYRRRRIQLFETAEPRVFGQVGRALLRAVEQKGDGFPPGWGSEAP